MRFFRNFKVIYFLRGIQVVFNCGIKFMRNQLIILVFLYQAYLAWHESLNWLFERLENGSSHKTMGSYLSEVSYSNIYFDYVNPHITFIAADCIVILSYYFTTDTTRIASIHINILRWYILTLEFLAARI